MVGQGDNQELKISQDGTLLVPDVVPIFPLPRVALLPGELLPLHIFEQRYRDMVRDSIASSRVLGMVSYTDAECADVTAPPAIRDIGCLGFIAEHKQLDDGRFVLWLVGLERFQIVEELPVETAYRQVRVRYVPVDEGAELVAMVQPLREELKGLLPRVMEADESTREGLVEQIATVTDPQLVALAAQILELPFERKQLLLEAGSLADRFVMVCEDLYARMTERGDATDCGPEILN